MVVGAHFRAKRETEKVRRWHSRTSETERGWKCLVRRSKICAAHAHVLKLVVPIRISNENFSANKTPIQTDMAAKFDLFYNFFSMWSKRMSKFYAIVLNWIIRWRAFTLLIYKQIANIWRFLVRREMCFMLCFFVCARVLLYRIVEARHRHAFDR